MKQLIDKSALMAEIEKRKYQFVSQAESFRKIGKKEQESYYAALASNMNSLSCFIDTLEVKKVNLEEEVEDWVKTGPHTSYPWCTIPDAIRITAEHFFELGLAQKGE